MLLRGPTAQLSAIVPLRAPATLMVMTSFRLSFEGETLPTAELEPSGQEIIICDKPIIITADDDGDEPFSVQESTPASRTSKMINDEYSQARRHAVTHHVVGCDEELIDKDAGVDEVYASQRLIRRMTYFSIFTCDNDDDDVEDDGNNHHHTSLTAGVWSGSKRLSHDRRACDERFITNLIIEDSKLRVCSVSSSSPALWHMIVSLSHFVWVLPPNRGGISKDNNNNNTVNGNERGMKTENR